MRLKSLMATAIALTIIATAAQAKSYDYQTVAGDLTKARIYTLDNGLKIYLSVNKEKPRIQTYIAVRTGSRNDPAETTGLAHYLEHLMFKGTNSFGTSDMAKESPLLDSIEARFEQYRHISDPQQRRTFYHEIDSISQVAAKYNIPNEYDKLMASIGAEGSNAYTSNDVTCYTEDIPSNEVENWAKIESDRFMNMVIRGFHTELEAVYEEYNIGIANDLNKEFEAIYAKLYPYHPYGTQSTIGTQEHLKNPSIVNIKDYFKRYYVPNNIAICMAGDLDPDEVVATIDRYFGSWRPNENLSYPQYAPIEPATAVSDTTVWGQEAENVMMGWRFDGAASPQCDTLDVISKMLYNGQAGLLDLNINQRMTCLATQTIEDKLNEYSSLFLFGMPKEGQTLDEVKQLMLNEVDKLKKGQFDDDLLPSVVNNIKLNHYKAMDNNGDRADAFVDAFINGKDWSNVVKRLDRIGKMTKQQIIDFANRHFGDNYSIVYKRTGTDSTLKKIDKPQITAIPTNRDMQSQFVTDIINSKTEPIQPRFIDFKADLAQGKTKKGLPVMYVKNNDNGIFTLAYYYKFGEESNKWLPFAQEYLDYLGTDKLTAEEVKQQFYKLACSYSINVESNSTTITLTGLDENRGKAVALLEDLLANAKADKEAYQQYVALVEKARADNKLDQTTNYNALVRYGILGEYNPMRNIPNATELHTQDPQALVDMIKALRNYEHAILYYGPTEESDLIAKIGKLHKTAKKLLPPPSGREYTEQAITANEIILAPYEAKNIYLTQYTNQNRTWTPERQPVIAMFNEYYGGGMNTVVFQELRESRALAYAAWANYNVPWRKGHHEYATANVISQNDKMMDCIRTFNNIIDTIPQSQHSFDLAKQSLLKKLASARTTKFDIINAYINAQSIGIDYDLNEKVYNALPSVSMNDMVEFERETMANKPYRYMILGDEKNLDIQSLEKIAPIRRLSTEEIFGY